MHLITPCDETLLNIHSMWFYLVMTLFYLHMPPEDINTVRAVCGYVNIKTDFYFVY